MKRITIILATLLATAAAHASERCAAHVHLAAYHAEAGYNNETPGLGVLCDFSEDVRVGAGAYHNSLERASVYAGATWQPLRVGLVKLGAFGGIVTGYRTSAMPFAAAVASIPAGPVELHIIAIPPVQNVTVLTLAASVSFKF